MSGPRAIFSFGSDHLLGLLFAQIRLINQWPDFFLAQQIPALVHGNLIQPSAESRPLIKPLQREICLYKNLLGNILHILTPPQNASSDSKDAVLMPPQELLKSLLVFALRPPNKFPVVHSARRSGARRFGPRRTGGKPQWLYFRDAWHVIPVTSNVAWFPLVVRVRFPCMHQLFQLEGIKFLLACPLSTWNNAAMIIGDRLRALREEKKLSQGDIEKRTGLLRCYISRVENGHTVPAIETLEKLARALECPLYQLFYDGEEPPQLPNLPKRKSSDDIAWGSLGKDARFLNKLRRLLGKVEEGDRKLILYMAQKMANR